MEKRAMEQKESSGWKDAKLTRQNSNVKKVSHNARKDSEKSMKGVDGNDGGSARPSSAGIKDGEMRDNFGQAVSPKVPKKIINNWRQACDKTKDKTKELLKKWRTMPESGQMENEVPGEGIPNPSTSSSGWSEHVWTVLGKKSLEEHGTIPDGGAVNLSEFQRVKFAHFFILFLDLDRDDVISLADFEAFSERLRHFSGWSKNSTEYSRLLEVQRGFIESFLLPYELQNEIHSYELLEKKLNKEQLSLDQWLEKWNQIFEKTRNYLELPLWLQYFPKLLFLVINRSGGGIITKDELSAFYISILGLTATQLEGFIDNAFKALTSNEEKELTYDVFRLCFANFLIARFPNGPGQYLFGPMSKIKETFFPIDYKAMCYATEDLEQYNPLVKTNRRSVIV